MSLEAKTKHQPNTIKFWHGGRFNGGVFEIGKGRKNKSEHGPGIYGSTHIETASKYAKGGGHITLIELDANIHWMDDSVVKYVDVIQFVKETPRLKNRKVLMDDVLRAIKRSGKDDGTIYASVLCNLCYFHNCLTGDLGIYVANFYKERNIHASLVLQGREDWIVIHDVSKILKTKIMTSNDAYREGMEDLGLIKHQLATIENNKNKIEPEKQNSVKNSFQL